VKEITGGEGVAVVYDSVGRTTLEGSARSLRPRGVLASYGEASGDPEPVPPRRLGDWGSIFLTHPRLPDYTTTRADLLKAANDLFAMVQSGKVKNEISHTYALQDAPQAHADLEARKTTGSIVLIP
jgi:NADPH2:quinone reductase